MCLVLSTSSIYLFNIYWVIPKTCRAFLTLIGFLSHLWGHVDDFSWFNWNHTLPITFCPLMLCTCLTLFSNSAFNRWHLMKQTWRRLSTAPPAPPPSKLTTRALPLRRSQFWNMFLGSSDLYYWQSSKEFSTGIDLNVYIVCRTSVTSCPSWNLSADTNASLGINFP